MKKSQTSNNAYTFPAHQGLIVGLKFRWPKYVDGTALCIGAAAPDMAYALGDFLNRQSHTFIGLIIWSLPITLIATYLVRWRAARNIFSHLPDIPGFRLRSFRVLSNFRHSTMITA